MKNISLCFFFFMLLNTGTTSAQNLVPNGNFDQVVECPSTLAALHHDCAHWYAGIQLPDEPWNNWPSPDWFHECSTHELISPPQTLIGNHEPCDGGGYGGLFTYDKTCADCREVMSIELTEPLIIGQLYSVIFYASRGYLNNFSFASNNIGVKFTTFAFWNSMESASDNTSHYTHMQVITDSVAWTPVSFEFTADSAYTHFHIGNFYDDSSTAVISMVNPDFGVWAYYLIDCVEVAENKVASTQLSHVQNSKFFVYPNPTEGIVRLDSKIRFEQFQILDLTGKVLLSGSFSSTLDLSFLSKGLYFLILEDVDGKQTKTKIIKS